MWRLLVNQLREEAVSVRRCLLVIRHRESINPSRDYLLHIAHLRAVIVQDLCDTSAGILRGKDIIVVPRVGALCYLEQHGQARIYEVRPGLSSFMRSNTNAVHSCLAICRHVVAHAVNKGLDNVRAVVPRLRTAELQHIIEDAYGPLALGRVCINNRHIIVIQQQLPVREEARALVLENSMECLVHI